MTALPDHLAEAVERAITSADLEDRDSGAVALVRRYAHLLDEARGRADEAELYGDLGPKLLVALTSLGLTLAGRVRGGAQREQPGGSKLDELRARRRTG